MAKPIGGKHYPRSVGEFGAWFESDADCLDYLDWLRWPEGFRCPKCGAEGWRMSDGEWRCRSCKRETSATAGTIFDRTRTPLTVWFRVVWEFATSKDGVSALELQRTLEIGSYQTAWAMLHRLRSVLVRPGRDRLKGTVEVDESYFGGDEPGLRAGRARGKKTLVGIAVERSRPRGFGRCRMAILQDASGDSLRSLLLENVEEGAIVVTDGWSGYQTATSGLYEHRHQLGSRRRAPVVLPGVHRVSALAKRWLLGTHQGSVDDAHLGSYLDEFVFRFNRRRSRSRGLLFYRVLELAVVHQPVRYTELVQNPRVRPGPSRSPRHFKHPPSLDRPTAGNPWRRAPLISQGI